MKPVTAALVAGALVLGACADGNGDGDGDQSERADPADADVIRLRAAPNDPGDKNIAVMAFLPARATVRAGATVEWSFRGPEPHTVTFLPTGEPPPTPDARDQFLEPTEVDTFDGTALANSGVRPREAQPAERFRLQFTKAGDFGYVCVVHPLMAGTITVTDDADAAESQRTITDRGDAEYDTYLDEGRAAKKELLDAAGPPGTAGTGPDGEPMWTIETGASTAHTEVLAFAPSTVRAKVGDRIVFVNNSAAPHTASFGGSLVPQDPTDPIASAPAPGPTPQPLVSGILLNTGLLPPKPRQGDASPDDERSYTFFATRPGTYAYVCIVHRPSAMVGTIVVV